MEYYSRKYCDVVVMTSMLLFSEQVMAPISGDQTVQSGKTHEKIGWQRVGVHLRPLPRSSVMPTTIYK